MIFGQKHLIKCRCVLPQFKNRANPPQHQFVVFSTIDDDVIKHKYVQCNNCGIIHKVVDICKSEIIPGKEMSAALITIDDVKGSLPKTLCDILESSSTDLPTWEHAQFIHENKKWGEFVVLNSEESDGSRSGKYVRILGESLFKVESYDREEIVK